LVETSPTTAFPTWIGSPRKVTATFGEDEIRSAETWNCNPAPGFNLMVEEVHGTRKEKERHEHQ
jgi:hypothetical protein